MEARFWEKVDKSGDCWEWTAGKDKDGYGQFRVNGKTKTAHRISYEINIGDISGMNVCHHCDNPGCVNPDHLFLGTQRDNIRDASKKGRLPPMHGSNAPNSRLTDIDIKLIEFWLAEGYTQKEIADAFGICRPHVSDIKTGRRWAKRS